MIDLIWKIPVGLLAATWSWAIWKIIRNDDEINKKAD